MNWKDVPIPPIMAHLPRDRRGYPIPVTVLIDKDGDPHFTVNEEHRRQQLFRTDCCSICGKKLLRGRWWIGGPGSALHPRGAFQDPPVHRECGQYALQVCPYLALASYTKTVGEATLSKKPDPVRRVMVDPTRIPNRPEPWVMVMSTGQKLNQDAFGNIRSAVPKRPYTNIEFWKDGVRLAEAEGFALANAYLDNNRKLLEDKGQWKQPIPFVS